MFSKTVAVFVSAMMIQTIAGQSIRNSYNTAVYSNELAACDAAEAVLANNIAYANLAYAPIAANVAYAPNNYPYETILVANNGLTYGLTLSQLSASNGGGFRVRSASPITPRGVIVESDQLVIEGPLAVSGQLPFLGVVALEGALPAAGAGTVAYACGNGNVGMVSEGVEGPIVASGFANGFATAYPNGFTLANGIAGFGYNGLGAASCGCGASN